MVINLLGKNNLRHQQWISSSGKEFGPLKHVVRDSIPDSYIWRKFDWDVRIQLDWEVVRIHLVSPKIHRRRLIIANGGGNFIRYTLLYGILRLLYGNFHIVHSCQISTNPTQVLFHPFLSFLIICFHKTNNKN
jgi:hypothetical protein